MNTGELGLKSSPRKHEEEIKKSKYNLRAVEAISRRGNIQTTEVQGKKIKLERRK